MRPEGENRDFAILPFAFLRSPADGSLAGRTKVLENRMDLDLSLTDHLLVACLRTELPAAAAKSLSRLSPAGWEELLKLAARQRMGPLVFARLKTEKLLGHMPQAVRDEWQALYRANAVRNLQIQSELGNLLGILRKADVSAIVLKGAWLAATAYNQPALRFMYDIDLLVSGADLPRAVAVLSEDGYHSFVQIAPEECLKTTHHWPRLFKEGAVAGIEVHWNLTKPGQAWNIAPDGLWQRARPVVLADTATHCLSPEDALLHVCLHLTHGHLFEKGISPLCDIDRLVRHSGNAIDWNALAERAQDWGWDRCVHLALVLASQTLQTPVPPQVLKTLEPDGFQPSIAETATRHMLADNRLGQTASQGFTQFTRERSPLKKLRLLFASVFHSPQLLAPTVGVPSNSPRIWLYYPGRAMHLLSQYGSRCMRLWVRQDKQEKRALADLANRREVLEQWLHVP